MTLNPKIKVSSRLTRRVLLSIALILLLLPLIFTIVSAQQNTILTVIIPQWLQDIYKSDYFDAFRAAHPGVDVIVKLDDGQKIYPINPSYAAIEEHLEAVQTLASSADVIWVTSYSVSIESTRAGYWLDLTPLVSSETTFSESDFLPAAWRAFRWDNSMWALPTTIDPDLLFYDPAQFDAAGLTYPDDNWTIDHFAEAARKLTQYDEDGAPTRIGFFGNIFGIIHALRGRPLYDIEAGRVIPNLEDPELAQMIELWAAVQEEITPQGGYSSQDVGMQMTNAQSLGYPMMAHYEVALLPGGYATTTVNGFGVSAGTAYPELAYELARYMTENPQASNFSRSISARTDVAMFTEVAQGYMPPEDFTPEQQAVVDEALANALVASDLLFSDYIWTVMRKMREDNLDPLAAVQATQALIESNLAFAEQAVTAPVLAVATAVPTPSFDSGQIVLNFGIPTWQLSDAETWQRVADEFAQADPQVGKVQISTQGNDYQTFIETHDCYYTPYNSVNEWSVQQWIPLTPFIDADPTFDKSDLIPGVLEPLTYEGQIYGYPLNMKPAVLEYRTEMLPEGITLPELTWTIDEFIDTLNQIETTDPRSVPFAMRYSENGDLLMLIAAYGGLPIDYRTNPPTINLTAPENVDAIRQVLDLAKNKLMTYNRLGTFRFEGGMSGTAVINAVQLQGAGWNPLANRKFIDYPQGSQYRAVAFGDVAGGYISTRAVNPDACYRWFSTIAQHPELFGDAMPARFSTLNDPANDAVLGESAMKLFRRYAELAADPNTVTFSTGFSGGTITIYMANQFINRAFDAYVLEDADLETELAAAQTAVETYIACMNALGTFDYALASGDEAKARSTAEANCLNEADPEVYNEYMEIQSQAP